MVNSLKVSHYVRALYLAKAHASAPTADIRRDLLATLDSLDADTMVTRDDVVAAPREAAGTLLAEAKSAAEQRDPSQGWRIAVALAHRGGRLGSVELGEAYAALGFTEDELAGAYAVAGAWAEVSPDPEVAPVVLRGDNWKLAI